MPKVSVIIPVFNTQNQLKQCLDSIVSQTLQDIEIIIVNDGSTDKTKDIADAYQKDYPVMIKRFYLIIYGNNLDDLNFVYQSVFEKMEINKLEPKKCDDAEIKAFFYYIFNPYGEKNEKYFRDNSFDEKIF